MPLNEILRKIWDSPVAASLIMLLAGTLGYKIRGFIEHARIKVKTISFPLLTTQKIPSKAISEKISFAYNGRVYKNLYCLIIKIKSNKEIIEPFLSIQFDEDAEIIDTNLKDLKILEGKIEGSIENLNRKEQIVFNFIIKSDKIPTKPKTEIRKSKEEKKKIPIVESNIPEMKTVLIAVFFYSFLIFIFISILLIDAGSLGIDSLIIPFTVFKFILVFLILIGSIPLCDRLIKQFKNSYKFTEIVSIFDESCIRKKIKEIIDRNDITTDLLNFISQEYSEKGMPIRLNDPKISGVSKSTFTEVMKCLWECRYVKREDDENYTLVKPISSIVEDIKLRGKKNIYPSAS